MIAYIKSISLKPGVADLTLAGLELESVRRLLPLIGAKLEVSLTPAQLSLPLDDADGLGAFR